MFAPRFMGKQVMMAMMLLATGLCSRCVVTAAEAGLGWNDLKAIAEATIQGTLERKAAEVNKIIDKKLGKATTTLNQATATPTPTMSSKGVRSTGAPPTTAQPQTTTVGGTTAQPQTTVQASTGPPTTSTVIPTTNPPTTPPPTTLLTCAALPNTTCNFDVCPDPILSSTPPYCGCPKLNQLIIENSAVLRDMSYYTCLQSIITSLALVNLINLTSLAGLQSLTTVQGAISLKTLPGLTTIDSSAFPALTSAGDNYFIQIDDNNNLAIISGFQGVTTTGYLEIVGNSALTTITGFSSLTKITGTRPYITSNPLLTDISGLSNLAHANNCTTDTTPPLDVFIVVSLRPANGFCTLNTYDRVCRYIAGGAAAVGCAK